MKVKYIIKLIDVCKTHQNPLVLNNIYTKAKHSYYDENLKLEFIILEEYPQFTFQASAFVIVTDDNQGERAPIMNNKPNFEKGIKPLGERQFN